jgi:hypothetical protein
VVELKLGKADMGGQNSISGKDTNLSIDHDSCTFLMPSSLLINGLRGESFLRVKVSDA